MIKAIRSMTPARILMKRGPQNIVLSRLSLYVFSFFSKIISQASYLLKQFSLLGFYSHSSFHEMTGFWKILRSLSARSLRASQFSTSFLWKRPVNMGVILLLSSSLPCLIERLVVVISLQLQLTTLQPSSSSVQVSSSVIEPFMVYGSLVQSKQGVLVLNLKFASGRLSGSLLWLTIGFEKPLGSKSKLIDVMGHSVVVSQAQITLSCFPLVKAAGSPQGVVPLGHSKLTPSALCGLTVLRKFEPARFPQIL